MAVYQKLSISTLLLHYKQPEIQQALVLAAENREVAVSFGGTGYGKRPDILAYPKDVLEFVKKGATSFHCSEEIWRNPLSVVTGMKPEELNELRIGWDLLLDIDCPELMFSQIAAHVLVQALEHHGISHYSIKFSGNHGFHIGVPFEAFPEIVNGVPVKDLFPDGPRRIAAYLQSMIRPVLAKELLARYDSLTIAEKIGKQSSELFVSGVFDPFKVLAIDTVLIASRHLYRMPYSLNEKSGLVSIVIGKEDLLTFNKETAKPENVKSVKKFLEREKVIPQEARKLFLNAFDFRGQENVKNLTIIEDKHPKQYEEILDAIPETYFPPCIQKISLGLIDGKKRALLILINFLSSCGWSFDAIEKYINEWNKKNQEPLRDVYILGQLRYAKQKKTKTLPPSCSNEAYMKGINVCVPDGFCSRIKNPAQYAIRKQQMVARMNEKKPKKEKVKKTDETGIEQADKNSEQKKNNQAENAS